MSWSTPRTWVAGENVTASEMNAHVRDNLSFLLTGGELSYREITTNGSANGGQGAASTFVTFDSLTFTGTERLKVEVFIPRMGNTGGNAMFWELHDGSAFMGIVAHGSSNLSSGGSSVYGVRYFTPASGTRAYAIKVYTGFGTQSYNAGDGSSGNLVPAFARLSRS